MSDPLHDEFQGLGIEWTAEAEAMLARARELAEDDGEFPVLVVERSPAMSVYVLCALAGAATVALLFVAAYVLGIWP